MSEINIQDISKAIDDILTEYLHSSFDVRQKAVQAGAEKFKEKIETVTPRDTGEMARSWKIKTKYPDVRYVGNTRVATGKVRRKSKGGKKGEARSGVPLSNVLEYSEKSPYKGFIRNCFDSCEQEIFNTIKNTLNNNGGN